MIIVSRDGVCRNWIQLSIFSGHGLRFEFVETRFIVYFRWASIEMVRIAVVC